MLKARISFSREWVLKALLKIPLSFPMSLSTENSSCQKPVQCLAQGVDVRGFGDVINAAILKLWCHVKPWPNSLKCIRVSYVRVKEK